MEIWKDIPEYEGLYEASTYGRIRSKDGKTTSNSLYKNRVWESRILKTRGAAKSGYRVSLWKNGKSKDFLVHRLVATTFLGKPAAGYTVNHKNGNRFDNRIENLEWLSREDNIRYGFEHGQYPQQHIRLQAFDRHYDFRSMAEASRFLKRSNGYISNRLKIGGNAYSYEGTEFLIIPVLEVRYGRA